MRVKGRKCGSCWTISVVAVFSQTQPYVDLTKTVDKTYVREGDYEAIFPVTAINQGNFPATSSIINNLPPAGKRFLVAAFMGDSNTESIGKWQPPELDVQHEVKLIFLACVNPSTVATTITHRTMTIAVTPLFKPRSLDDEPTATNYTSQTNDDLDLKTSIP